MSLKIKDMPTGKCPCGLDFGHWGPHFKPSPHTCESRGCTLAESVYGAHSFEPSSLGVAPSPAKPEVCRVCGKPLEYEEGSKTAKCRHAVIIDERVPSEPSKKTCPKCGFGLRVGYGGHGLFCLNKIYKCGWYSSDYKQIEPSDPSKGEGRPHYACKSFIDDDGNERWAVELVGIKNPIFIESSKVKAKAEKLVDQLQSAFYNGLGTGQAQRDKENETCQTCGKPSFGDAGVCSSSIHLPWHWKAERDQLKARLTEKTPEA